MMMMKVTLFALVGVVSAFRRTVPSRRFGRRLPCQDEEKQLLDERANRKYVIVNGEKVYEGDDSDIDKVLISKKGEAEINGWPAEEQKVYRTYSEDRNKMVSVYAKYIPDLKIKLKIAVEDEESLSHGINLAFTEIAEKITNDWIKMKIGYRECDSSGLFQCKCCGNEWDRVDKLEHKKGCLLHLNIGGSMKLEGEIEEDLKWIVYESEKKNLQEMIMADKCKDVIFGKRFRTYNFSEAAKCYKFVVAVVKEVERMDEEQRNLPLRSMYAIIGSRIDDNGKVEKYIEPNEKNPHFAKKYKGIGNLWGLF